MEELRPLLAIIGLLVVAGGLFFWIARLRGWRFEWWERFQSPGRARGSRAGAGGASGPRSTPDRPGSSAPVRSRGPEGVVPGRPGAKASRQTLIDLEFLPLLDPEDAVQGKPIETSLDREYDVGDLGSVETEGEEAARPPRARAAPSGPPRESSGRAPESKPEPGPEPPRRRPVSKQRRPVTRRDSRAGSAEPPSGPRRDDRELLIVLTILAPGEGDLAGPAVREALAAFDLAPDDLGMFHHYGNRDRPGGEPVFSVANVLEPGVFDVEAMDELATPGLCLFMRRPGPLPAAVAFDLMLDVGARLSRTLEAVLCDDQRCRLTAQATQALRERVVHFAFRHERAAPNAR